MPSLSAENLLDLVVPRDVRLSPDGTRVIYSANCYGKNGDNAVCSIWVADVGKEKSARQLTSGKFNDTSPRWSSDGKSIAFLSDRAKAGESSAIYLLSMDGGEAYAITRAENRRGIDSFDWSPNGSFIAYLSADEKSAEHEQKEKDKDDADVYGENWEYNRLRLLHVATREVTTLVEKDAHVADFAWSEESLELAYTLHETPDLNSAGYKVVSIERVSISDKKVCSICKIPGPVQALVWSARLIYFLASFSLDKQVSSVSVYKASLNGDWSKEGFGENNCADDLRRVGSSVVVKVLEGVKDQLHVVYDVASSDSPISSEWSFSDGSGLDLWDIGVKDKAPVVVAMRSTGSCPNEVYSIQDGHTCQLSQHGQSVTALELGNAEYFYCKARDGVDLDGVLFTPSKRAEGPLPTVVLVHGGPYGRVTIGFNRLMSWAPWLMSAGLAVFCPNYRGGSGHGETFASQDRGAIGTKGYEDIITMTKEGIFRKLFDESRIAVAGWSAGGFLSFLAVTREDFQFKAAICGAGITDWDMMAMTSDLYTYGGEYAGGLPWVMGPKSIAQRHGSAIWNMSHIKTPILILHGATDVRVPLSQATAFHRGCLHYDVPCEMVVYPREGHSISERKHLLDMLKRAKRFMDVHLK